MNKESIQKKDKSEQGKKQDPVSMDFKTVGQGKNAYEIMG